MSEDVPSLKRIAEPRSLKPAPGVVVGYRRVRTKGTWAVFIISLIMVAIGLALIVHPPMSSKVAYTIDDELKPQYYFHPWFVLKKGEKLEVRGTVRGGNNDIWIYVKEGGRTVEDFKLVKSPVDVIFTAPEDGNYTLYIDNSMSLVSSKILHLELIRHYYDYVPGGLFLFFGFIALLVSLIGLMIGQKRLMIRVGDETYEFWPTNWGKVNVAVNGVTLDSKVKPGDKFRIGPNDEHILEIKMVGRFFKKTGFFVDGREVGRLP
ncbi:emp24/gp25L/p24 family protein [Thermococcus gammatolerans]|uniref:Uncharacterized protein n=1 Tax=Thermococcus gammatolerans (strain DSM 15229 / JCM 11827 / EJ3) TaxID=593117 RepID=C5A4K6_THEGJ|nr:emp24/gp25L/p24 family protein [Thermococcus gammatolerans]ACS33168.1 Conserved hypothetical protein [Thermococcus gammatolerans EJ3]